MIICRGLIYQNINLLCKNGLLYIWQNPSAFNSDYVVAVFTEKITDKYQQIWLTEIKSNNKLETYVLLKNEFIKENYIDILKEKHLLRAMSRLRTSCHPLKIETGRHCKPPLPRQNRICSVCNVIEDEEHFLVSCKKYEAERLSLFKFVKHIKVI